MSRILIADDEQIECRALELMLHTDFPEETVLPSAGNGLTLIDRIEEYHPDLVIVDINMPGLSGLDALEMIRSRFPDMKIIISTAYSDFEYLKRALLLGASDYLLKPLKRSSFKETMGRLLSVMEAERDRSLQDEDLRRNLDEMYTIVGNEFLSSLLLGEPSRASFERFIRTTGQEYAGCGVLIVNCIGVSGRDSSENKEDKEWLGQLNRQLYLMLRKECVCVGKPHNGALYYLLFPPAKMSGKEGRRWVAELLTRVLSRQKLPDSIQLCCGLGRIRKEPEDMLTAVDEARLAIRGKNEAGIFFFEEKEERRNPLESWWMEMIELLRQKKTEEMLALLKKGFETDEIKSLSFEVQKLCAIDGLVPVMEHLGSKNSGLGCVPEGIWPRIGRCESLQDLEDWAESGVRALLASEGELRSRVSDYVAKALLYMSDHYSEDLSLEKTAQSAGISPFYLSRLLKQEMHRTFVEVLTDFRMEQVLHLLWEGNGSVREIAEQCGYRNVTYFYKVFKKYMGVNVSDLREFMESSHGEITT